MYYVYILKNQDGEKYIGVTSNLKIRIEQHNSSKTKTTKGEEYKVIGYSAFSDKEKAHSFEKYLKSSSGYAFTNKHFI